MEVLLLCGLLVMAGVTPSQGGFLNLNKMVWQVTKKIPIFSIWSYGCHCGIGGRGQPKDATDRCCQKHDCCYTRLKESQCRPQMDHYNYTFSGGDVECPARGSWCEQQLCACDKELAFCLKTNRNTYQKKLHFVWRPKCKGSTPTC